MKKVNAQDTIIEKIQTHVAQKFINENSEDKINCSTTVVYSFGMFTDDELIGVVQFTTPITQEMKKEYSSELLNIAFKQNTQIVGDSSTIIKYYIDKHDASDIFIHYKKFDKNANIYKQCGFKLVNKKNNIKVYEWINPNKTHYTYKITAKDSNKYYYGVSHVKIKNATIKDCEDHRYFGSGGKWQKNNKFVNWKNKHKNKIKKEVLQTFNKKSDAYKAENRLIGDSWKNDKKCLNSVPGGTYTGINADKMLRFTYKICNIHGETKHAGNTCAKCTSSQSIVLKTCDTHGETKHIGKHCRKCLNSQQITKKKCGIHGLTKHTGNTCYKCLVNDYIVTKKCDVHGMSTFFGNTCQKCVSDRNIIIQKCEIHGNTKHKNNKCYKCLSAKNITLKTCSIHGETKHIGDTCCQCTSNSSLTQKECSVHGLTGHIGDKCRKCINDGNMSLRKCPIHGETKHIGEKCYKCRNTKYVLNNCSVHGETYFVNDDCLKCVNAENKMVDMAVCPSHGLVKHMGGVCSSCRSQDAIGVKECVLHGLTKHRGDACSKCSADKAAHRYHTLSNANDGKNGQDNDKDVFVEKTKENCSLCQKEILEGVRRPLVKKEIVQNRCELCGEMFVAKHKRQLFCSNPHDWTCAVCGDKISPVPRKGKSLYSCFSHRREVSLMMKP